jgi:hypothetical protein
MGFLPMPWVQAASSVATTGKQAGAHTTGPLARTYAVDKTWHLVHGLASGGLACRRTSCGPLARGCAVDRA